MAVIGYLNNLCFDKGAEELEEKIHIYSTFIRHMMIETIEDLFKNANVPYFDPVANVRYPIGGFFFKIQGKPEDVLSTLGLDDSMEIPLKGHKTYKIKLGIIVKDFPNDNNLHELSFSEDNVLDLAAHVAAHYRITGGQVQPYFLIVDENFEKKFPIDSNLDLT
ncbi:MAG: hypothetical protein J7K22_04360 [Nanoarchaeota archaeon]|nr:hypothetical protein [Nanoarchaeota archaeon]